MQQPDIASVADTAERNAAEPDTATTELATPEAATPDHPLAAGQTATPDAGRAATPEAELEAGQDTPIEQAFFQAARALVDKETQTLEDLEAYRVIVKQLPVVDFSQRARDERLANSERYQEIVQQREGRIAYRKRTAENSAWYRPTGK